MIQAIDFAPAAAVQKHCIPSQPYPSQRGIQPVESLVDVILYFMIYAILGWILETAFVSMKEKKFINRGFLIGPMCPVYIFGALFVIRILQPVSHHIFIVFICGIMITSAVEYITGYLLEHLFHMKWWDYSDRRFNLNGRVCLGNSIAFGFLSVALILVIHPFFVSLLQQVPFVYRAVIAGICIFLLIVDIVFSVIATLRLSGKLDQLHKFLEKNQRILQEKNEALQLRVQEAFFSAAKKIQNGKQKSQKAMHENVFYRRILDAFPGMRSQRFDNALSHIREAIKTWRDKQKEK
jgi:uncharacterized membrane protein